ncbi:MAG: RagB/SusD family nutrient uptake outer membrane protein [Bacteroidales bacterium]
MKNILLSLSIILLVITPSCEEYLEVDPSSSLLAEQAFTSKNDIVYGINGCYDAFQFSGYYGRTLININDLAADNAYNGGTILEYGQVNNNNILEDNALIEGIWADIYTAINRVNTIIDILDDVEITPEEKAEFEAELRFLRALHYYNLSTHFGEVPIKNQPTKDLSNLSVSASSIEEIQSFMLEDLEFAMGKISNTDPVKATNYAVETLRAKIYLYQSQWDSVFNITTRIINSDFYSLEEDYENLFISEGTPESIFEIDFNAQDKNRLAEYFYPNTLNGRYEMAPEQNLIEAYEPNDKRKSATIDDSGNNPYVKKYENLTDGSDNVYVFRFAEIYLMRAEANAQRGTGTINIKSDINKIRTRAGLSGVIGSTTEDLLLAIEKERRLEFAFEGHRWRDLVRTGRAAAVLPNISGPDQYYFPIPLSEKQTNNEIN